MLSSLTGTDSFMASNTTAAHRSSVGPSPLRTSRSFTRPDPAPTSHETNRPKRAATMQPGGTQLSRQGNGDGNGNGNGNGKGAGPEAADTFDSGRISEESSDNTPRQSVDMDGLPIELISLADSFIDQLSAKTRPTPPTIDNLSQLFQDFYATAATHIQTHIDSIATRQRRESSPAPSSSSRASAASLLRAKAASLGGKEKHKATPPPTARQTSEQQLLTADEYADRKRARKALEKKRVLLEEAVERRLCEGIYDKIYRHHTTQDEAQDDKLRSKTAALAVVGIGLADLGIEITTTTDPETAAKKQDEVKNRLEQARKELVLMNQSRYPLGKLNHLKAAHKSIIDTLSHFHPSSSADELMPMLIYTLITLPPENLNVISDLNFIHRFRWEPKLFGEAAYCLTNLEATISFLETVDLSTLRADEAPTGPAKGSTSSTSTPKAETFPPAYSPGLSSPSATTTLAVAAKHNAPIPSGLRAAVALRNRRLSDLVNTPAQAFNAASDAVFSTADQGLKTISTSLGDSYKFLLGKLRDEHPEALITGKTGEVMSLEDARKLIGTPPPHDDEGSVSGASSVHSPEDDPYFHRPLMRRSGTPRAEDKVLSIIGGTRKPSRDHSADSARSAGKTEGEVKEKNAAAAAAATPSATSSSSSSNPALIDSMRNLGNSLNPMNRLTSFRGFGRSGSTTPSPGAVSKDAVTSGAGSRGLPADGGDLATAFPELAPVLPPKEIPKIDPPIKRFMEIQSPADLRLGEVLELLRDYRRLAGALKDLGGFKE
ncbi:hypothetical protein B0T19DRAFT_415776 [Cercophora scortea]|uniref:VPS9 domain-containing protein n=1 Tax=Cercophora scortea TaxID=314031 RepID=A0AAE0MIN6_9PEZI|nr:hypothetical protein B0T19DRAFT_415776 [Cercophora scortea]